MSTLNLLRPEINELLAKQDWDSLREVLLEFPEQDIAELLQELDDERRLVLLRLLPRDILPEVFSYLDDTMKKDVMKAVTEEEIKIILAGMPPDDRTDFLETLPGRSIQMLVSLLSPDDRRETLQLLGYPAESVGRLMTPDYVAVRPEWTVQEALDHIRRKGLDSETINIIYVTDRYWHLLGVVGLRRLILARPDERIEEIMETNVVTISPLEDREKAVQTIQHYDVIALPVVDGDGVMLGIITVDDLFDVAVEEVTEDFQKSAAVKPLKTSYRESSALALYRKRVVWLASLLGISVVTTGIISWRAETLSSAIALAFFIPLLIGTGGNTGNQSSTLMIRALATGDIKDRQWINALFREIVIGCLLALTMGAASWILGLIKGGAQIAAIVSLSMMAIVIVSSILGVVLPIVLQRFRIDPAVASNPLIASVMDIVGLLIYFQIATTILKGF
ncbi:MAG TPA: magnesium transporter [Syntrophales bacterium]|nr:magnesium transporter [Syntrophales bacterium]HOO00498.1 magnesium transporter [Syntrophales bacterium]HPC01163.1 magnesium transporter [Syntrophales bacterium]HPQ07331.1 magnesium transporter [Syntrophales bacterium]HRS87740.1 magnesium transporter [Syntrophales bacterium]